MTASTPAPAAEAEPYTPHEHEELRSLVRKGRERPDRPASESVQQPPR
jgi:hypothetical protein